MTDPEHRLATALADRYRLEGELGQGGMATVYLAHDVRHDRKVALKVLRPELSAILGAERFLAEIKTTANLQHPHILGLFDSGEADGLVYYVMPYVEGESLRDRLKREHQLPVDDAVRIACEVADALEYAHQRGVVHRDIKPENILLHGGHALVADFGIALAVSRSEGGTRMTETGMSLGTPHYMSPEQAMGEREITARADVYALGCVVYEMLAGDPPFTGSTAQAIVARVLTDEPRSLTLQRRTIPPHVEAAVRTALEKLPADRFASAAAFAGALRDPTFTSTTATVRGAGATPQRTPLVVGLAITTVLASALALWGWIGRDAAFSNGPGRDRVVLGSLGAFPFHLSTGTAIAPDGSAIAWTDTVGGQTQIWIKERAQRDAAPLPGTVGAAGAVSFSPDGEWILFSTGPLLRKIARRGGAAVTLSDSSGNWSAAWLDNGTILFSGPGPTVLYRVSSDGGPTERMLTSADLNNEGVVRVAPVPGRNAVLIGGVQANFALGNVWLVDLDRREPHLLVPGAGWAEYTSTGHLVYGTRDGALLAAPLDLDSYTLGTPTPLDNGLRMMAGVVEATLGRDGTLLYSRGERGTSLATLVWVDRAGKAEPVDPAMTLNAVPLNGGMRLSPEGGRLAFTKVGEAAAVAQELYVKRLPTGPAARVTFAGSSNRRPTWSPDGTKLLFISDRGGRGDAVWTQRADGVGAATLVVEEDRAIFEALWSPDGKWIVFRTDDDAGVGRGDILGIRPGVDSTPVPLVATPAEETAPALSPDGRWLAYAANETGRKEVYVRPFPGTADGKWLISSRGGIEPAWARSGRELFYRDGLGNMIAVTFRTTGGTFEVLDQQALFSAQQYWSNDDHRWYDVTADGKRFIMVDPGFGADSVVLVKVSGLFAELRAR